MDIKNYNYFLTPNTPKKSQKKKFTDKFIDYTKNSADMNDTVIVPRTIFKGYLGFMAGTTLTSLGAVFKKYGKLSRTLNTFGILTCLYGTWAFVRPFIIKDAPCEKQK